MPTKPNHARIYKPVPQLLRGCREEAGLTQRDLAARAKRPQWWVHRIESGSRRIDVAEFVLWVRACGGDPRELLGRLMAAR